MDFIIKGIFCDTDTPDEVRIRGGGILVSDGEIREFLTSAELSERTSAQDDIVIYDYSGKLIFPGFSDLHLHAPQYSYAGTAMDLTLLDWLTEYTYPVEASFSELAFAKEYYTHFVNDLLHGPATHSCIFATQHTDATLILMDLLEESGLVSYTGKLNMDRNCPDYYSEHTAEEGLRETERWIHLAGKRQYTHTFPMLTPRFTPSVSDAYMEGIGRLSRTYGLPMQSHLSENLDEIAWVHELRPEDAFYGESYDKYGLFGDTPTVMAHCIYSGEEERKLMKEKGVMIAHCPTSNVNVIAGICPAAMYLREGYRIGIGSDVAGGNTLNLFEVMREAIKQSKIRYHYLDQNYAPLKLSEVLYMATAGGGDFFGKVGKFEEGFRFDAIVMDDASLSTPKPLSTLERIERYIYLGDGKPEAKFADGTKLF